MAARTGHAEVTAEDHFRQKVWPLLDEACVRCHGPDKQKNDLRLDSREAVLKGGKGGPAVVVGNPKDSLLLQLVKHSDPERNMPPKKDLTAEQTSTLERWIADGAPWPANFEAVSRSPSDRIGNAWSDPRNPIAQLFGGKRLDLWSFKPIANVLPPRMSSEGDSTNPIDALVFAQMKGQHLQPAPEADRRTLARRLYFDLIGLPPTPEEMQAFLADTSSEAYERLVDGLLASPHYGEHWGRMWLDVIRYSDSNGFDWDEFRPKAWRFRDYVIRSLNADKPFNRFVCEQLAGDEMLAGPPRNNAEQDCLIATGYLRVGPYDNSAKQFGEMLQCRTQVLSDLVETTGAAFLGLNLSCCRCHNHKFDPISTQDYYRLRAFFEGVQASDELPLDLANQQAAVRQHNESLDAGIKNRQDLIAGILKPVSARLAAAKVAKLNAEDQAMLKQDLDSADAETQKSIRKLQRFVAVKDPEVEAALSKDEKSRRDKLKVEMEELEKKRQLYEVGLLATDAAAAPAETHVLYQGDCKQPREVVPPGFLSALDPNPAVVKPPVRPNSSGRRSALAAWLVSENNPLTARVLVNRVWQAHFGEGLVATANDFGFVGARPSNPQLLDWLAAEFMREGWSLKKLHRLIVTSATYKQSLGESTGLSFASQRPRRLSAEALRDSLLYVSGALLSHAGGPPLWPELPEDVRRANPSLNDYEAPLKQWTPSPEDQTYVRTVFLVQKRSVRLPMLETFDLPENNLSCPLRNVSTSPPQALTLLNDSFSVEMARRFAERIVREVGVHPEALIKRAFKLALQREPDAAETSSCLRYMEKHNITEFCRVVLNLNEFCYVD